MLSKPYAPHKGYIAPARLRGSLFLVVLGLMAIEMAYRASFDVIDALFRDIAPEAMDAFYLGATPLSLTAQLLSFSVLALAVILVARLVHQRGALTLLGPPRSAVRQFIAVLLPVMVLLALLELVPPWWSRDALEETRNLISWTLFLPIALVAVFIQIGAEELMYRGYLQQQLAVVFPHPAAWLILTNLLFGLAHWSAGAGGAASLQYVVWAFFMGLCVSDLVARAGTLGPALAFHFANNLFAFMLYGEAGGYSTGYALFLFPEGAMGGAFEDEGVTQFLSWQLVVELLILFLMWLAARIGLRR